MSTEPPSTNGRTVLTSTTISRSNGWWVGIVRDRDPVTGEIRLRLERERRDRIEGWKNIHTWRVRPDYWPEEVQAVETIEAGGGRSPPPSTPVDQRYDVTRYVRVRKDADRWVAAVRLERPSRPNCTRLYHWRSSDGKLCQKWTAGRDWARIKDFASGQLPQPV